MTGSFSMNTGVRQGCLLSPLLFLVALDWVSQQAFGDNKTGIQFTLFQKLEDLDFAVDMVLLSQKITHMRQKFATLVEQAARVSLKINAPKTKEMKIRSPANTGNVNCVGEVLKQVSAFTYLGSLVATTGGTEEDVEARCRKAQVAFSILRPIWRSNFISLWTKMRIFNSNVKSVLLHGSPTPNFRLLLIADSGTSWECGGPERFLTRSCGSVHSKKGLKTPSEEENGDGSATF